MTDDDGVTELVSVALNDTDSVTLELAVRDTVAEMVTDAVREGDGEADSLAEGLGLVDAVSLGVGDGLANRYSVLWSDPKYSWPPLPMAMDDVSWPDAV